MKKQSNLNKKGKVRKEKYKRSIFKRHILKKINLKDNISNIFPNRYYVFALYASIINHFRYSILTD